MTTEIAQTLPAVPDSVPVARHLLDRLGGVVEPSHLDDLRLLVTEVVTNSIRHASGGPSLELRVTVTRSTVRVEVEDRGAGFDPRAGSPVGGTSRWGLFLVDRIADRWGVLSGRTTTVWFELDRIRRAAAPL